MMSQPMMGDLGMMHQPRGMKSTVQISESQVLVEVVAPLGPRVMKMCSHCYNIS